MKIIPREIYFLNPKENFICKLLKDIEQAGYEINAIENHTNDWLCVKEKQKIVVSLWEDYIGPCIYLICENVPDDDMRKALSVCPECGSDDFLYWTFLKLHSKVGKQMCEEGKLQYWPGAYDRHGTKPQTCSCKKCGCKWFNMVDYLDWCE